MENTAEKNDMEAMPLVVKKITDVSGKFQSLAGLEVSETLMPNDNIYAYISGICDGIDGGQSELSVSDDLSSGAISDISYFSWRSGSAFVASVRGLTANNFLSGYDGYYYQSDTLFDAEKCTSITKDDQMCWAATAANMLKYAGWELTTATTEDSIFSVFVNNFQYGDRYGGKAVYGIEWYFTGDYDAAGWDEWDAPRSGTGGYYESFFSSNDLDDYLYTTGFTLSGLKQAEEKLKNGYAVGVGFGFYDSIGWRSGGHAVTLWGLTYNTSLSVTDPNYYTGIIISDSDDDKYSYSVATSAPDTIKIIPIYYDSSRQKYILDSDYAGYGTTGILENLTFLAPYVSAKNVKIYSSGTLTSQGSSFTGTIIRGGGNNSMYVSSGGIASNTHISSGGAVHVFSKGFASSTNIYSGGSLNVSSGGSASFNSINNGACLYARNGAAVSYSLVSSGGRLVFSSGATGTSNNIFSSGRAVVYSGAVASNNSVFTSGNFFVEGGRAYGNVVSGNSAYLGVYYGGYASKNILQNGAWISVFSGGSASNTDLTSASLYVIEAGKVSSTYVRSGALLDVNSDGAAYYTYVYKGGVITLSSGGTASGTTVSSGGYMYISTGARHQGAMQIATGATVSAYSGSVIDFTISNRTTSDTYLINNLALIKGAPTYTVTVSSNQALGTYKLASGASGFTGSITVRNTSGTNYAALSVGDTLVYGDLKYTLVNTSGNLSLVVSEKTNYDLSATYSDGVYGGPLNVSVVTGTYSDSSKITEADNVYVDWIVANMGDAINSSYQVALYLDNVLLKVWTGADGLDEDHIATIDDYNLGKLTAGSHTLKLVADYGNAIAETNENNNTYTKTFYVSSTASNVKIYSSGTLTSQGSSFTGTIIRGGGNNSMYVSSGGVVNSAAVSSGGCVYVNSGGTINAAKVNYSGYVQVNSGGMANSAIVNSMGDLSILAGGKASVAQVNSDGIVYVYSGGTANSTSVNYWGYLLVDSGGTANFTSVNSIGDLRVYDGGIANSTTVNSAGCLFLYEGGTVNSTTVKSGGYLTISSGGLHKGSLQISSGATVSAYSGSMIDFTISNRTTSSTYVINNLSLIQGAPSYTVTVSASQAFGTYKLAQRAGSFAGTLSVGDGSVAYGSVTVNGEDLVYNGVNYSLDLVGGDLTLTIGRASAPVMKNDLDGNGLADTILRHTLQGDCGAWLTKNEGTSIGWGNLSNIGNDVKLLGMGNVKDSSDSGLDIFMLNGDTVAAWVTEGGKVTAYQSLYKHNANMNVLGLADFDGDGVTDYLLRSNTGDVGCIMGNGNRWNYFQSLGKEWNIAATGDFNGDGRDDLVLKHDAGFAGTWLTQENGSVKWADLDTLSGGLEIIGSGDFNGDGTDDVLLRKGNWVGAWLVEEGSVDSFMGIKNNLTSTVEQIADFDGDGIDDLRVREGSDIGVLYVKGADTTQWQYFKSVGSEWRTAFDAQVV